MRSKAENGVWRLLALAAVAPCLYAAVLLNVQESGEQAAQPEVTRQYVPLSRERLNAMLPKHPGQLGALAPANLNAARPPASINLTGTLFVDLSGGFAHFLLGRPYPRFGPEGMEALIHATAAQAEGRT